MFLSSSPPLSFCDIFTAAKLLLFFLQWLSITGKKKTPQPKPTTKMQGPVLLQQKYSPEFNKAIWTFAVCSKFSVQTQEPCPCTCVFSALMLQKELNQFSRKYSLSYLNNYSCCKSVALYNLWFLLTWPKISGKWGLAYIKIKFKSICLITKRSI